MLSPGLPALLAGLAILLAAYALLAPRGTIPKSRKARQESQDAVGRYVKPMLGEILPSLGNATRMSDIKRDSIQQLIVRAGNPWNLTPEEYRGTQFLFALLGAVFGVVLILADMTAGFPWLMILLMCAGFGFLVPYSVHNTARQKRASEIQKQLPEALDLLVVTMSSGLNFEPALQEVTPRLPDGLLKDELGIVSREIAAGQPLARALMNFSERAASDEAEGFAKAVAQAQDLGADVSDALAAQAVSARDAFEALLEKKIASLPTRMFAILAPTLLPAFLLIFLAPAISQLQMGLG